MAKRLTVFYSWQSDSPPNLNRSFIEKALHEALKRLNSNARLENALREAMVELDKDTQGVAGSPPIADTILNKIEGCAVFVADLSYVGESKHGFVNAAGKPRQFPNPNVLIEYGYALRCHSHSKLIGVMNSAYGSPDAESLPFDLRHLRWPRTYHLADASAADKKEQFETLVRTLVKDIDLILSGQSLPSAATENFVPRRPTTNAAVFFDSGQDLVTERSEASIIPEGAKAYLRLWPTVSVPQINTELESMDLTVRGNLLPMGEVNPNCFDRNKFGSLVAKLENGKPYHFTQLFLTREIWGVDAECVNADCVSHRFNDSQIAYIASGYVEDKFVRTLQNFLAFSKVHLNLPLPLQLNAGLVGIRGYPITINAFNVAGKSLHDTISWHTEVLSYERPAWEILAPFFDRVWDNCGIARTAQHHAEYVRRFSS